MRILRDEPKICLPPELMLMNLSIGNMQYAKIYGFVLFFFTNGTVDARQDGRKQDYSKQIVVILPFYLLTFLIKWTIKHNCLTAK